MTIQISTQDARTAKALELLAGADRWLKVTGKAGGRRYYVIPGSNGRLYWTNLQTCTCPDAQHRPELTCKHRQAAALRVAQLNAERKPGRAACSGCLGTSAYHKARCGRNRVPLLGRIQV